MQDDVHLAAYIADNHPDKTLPGRKGNRLYQNLCSDVRTVYPIRRPTLINVPVDDVSVGEEAPLAFVA